MSVNALSALRDLFAMRRRQRRCALPRWAYRNTHLTADGPRDFAWSHEVIAAEIRTWGSAG